MTPVGVEPTRPAEFITQVYRHCISTLLSLTDGNDANQQTGGRALNLGRIECNSELIKELYDACDWNVSTRREIKID